MPEHARPRADRPVARAIWSGSITFGLVSIPVELFSAQRPARPSLRMLSPTGTPLARRYVSSVTGKPVTGEDMLRGYEVEDGKFIIVSDEELEKLAPRKSRDIELLRFVKQDEIDPAYIVHVYFLLPGKSQARAYGLLAKTMEDTKRAGIGSFVMRDHGYVAAIWAEKGLLRAATLRFHDQVRSWKDIGIGELPEPKAADVKRFKAAIGKLEEKQIRESEFRDDEVEHILELARKKHKQGKDVVEAPEQAEEGTAQTPVIDLLAELKKRMEQKARPGTAAHRRTRAVRSQGRRTASKSR